jgi:putative transposase
VKPLSDRRLLIEPEHKNLSVVKQCELLDVSRSGFYYEPVPETEENLAIMRVLDEQYLKNPFFGIEKLVVLLILMGYKINKKRLLSLMKIQGWETLYCVPRTTKIDATAY